MKHYTSVLCLYCDILITTYSLRLHEINLTYQNKHFIIKTLVKNLKVCRYAKYPCFELKHVLKLVIYGYDTSK